MPLSRRDLHALAGAYALDALEEGPEQERFTRHLRRCRACAEEVRGFREVATALAFAATAEPPPELRERVMAAVGRTRQLPPEVTPQGRLRFSLPQLPPSVWLPRLATVAAAGAIAAVVVLSVVLSGTRQQLNSERTQSQAIAAVLAAPDVTTATGQVTSGGAVTVLLSADKRELVVSTRGLAAVPAGKTYELWLIGPSSTQKTAIRRAGLLPPAVAGLTTPALASGLVSGDELGMTVEPAGGTNQPTTTPILLLSLSTKTQAQPGSAKRA
jgi:anti-sigma factor RsiW